MSNSAHYIVEFGCYVDGLHGIYVPSIICDFASSLGWNGHVPSEDDCRDDAENASADAEEALEWLNANIATEDASFGWHEGGIFYFSLNEWEEAF